jgi:hypothetical protein
MLVEGFFGWRNIVQHSVSLRKQDLPGLINTSHLQLLTVNFYNIFLKKKQESISLEESRFFSGSFGTRLWRYFNMFFFLASLELENSKEHFL